MLHNSWPVNGGVKMPTSKEIEEIREALRRRARKGKPKEDFDEKQEEQNPSSVTKYVTVHLGGGISKVFRFLPEEKTGDDNS